jgi:hypothetical protein
MMDKLRRKIARESFMARWSVRQEKRGLPLVMIMDRQRLARRSLDEGRVT